MKSIKLLFHRSFRGVSSSDVIIMTEGICEEGRGDFWEIIRVSNKSLNDDGNDDNKNLSDQ